MCKAGRVLRLVHLAPAAMCGLSAPASHMHHLTPPRLCRPAGATYVHWGKVMPAGLVSEPDNTAGDERCAVANASEAYGGAWGWSDTRCSGSYAFMCRAAGEERGRQAQGGPQPA